MYYRGITLDYFATRSVKMPANQAILYLIKG
jgi:hypothetical protein